MRNDTIFNYTKDGYKGFLSIINNKKYIFRATLLNPDNIVVEFQKSAIKELILHDNIFNPFFCGSITIDNTDDVIERYISDSTLTEFYPDTDIIRGYRTRGDARDLLLLTILPIVDGTEPYDTSTELFNSTFGFRYVFCLVNETEVSSEIGKLKKYDIEDFDCQVLKGKKIFFSTANIQGKKNVANLTNDERSAFTGAALKSILTTGLGDPTSILTTLSGSVPITPKFENGISELFYSSPNNSTGYDDLLYVYKYHVSNNSSRDFAFLKKDNYSGEYTLESVAQIFSKAYNKQTDSGGEYYQENLTITGGQDINNVIMNDLKKPLKAIEFGETGDVIEVKFSNPSGKLYQERIRSLLVHSYEFDHKEFAINGVDGNIENVKTDFMQFYVDPMKGKNNQPAPNLTLNNTQKTNQNYDSVFIVYSSDDNFIKLAVGRNELLKNAMVLNLGVEITVPGSMHRKSGGFLSIDRRGSYVDNDFDNKFLGIYFILDVEHTFVDDNTYINKIIAVKTYQFTNLNINESTQ